MRKATITTRLPKFLRLQGRPWPAGAKGSPPPVSSLRKATITTRLQSATKKDPRRQASETRRYELAGLSGFGDYCRGDKPEVPSCHFMPIFKNNKAGSATQAPARASRIQLARPVRGWTFVPPALGDPPTGGAPSC